MSNAILFELKLYTFITATLTTIFAATAFIGVISLYLSGFNLAGSITFIISTALTVAGIKFAKSFL